MKLLRKTTMWMILGLFYPLGISAQDAQWRGPERDGIYRDTALLEVWPEEGPAMLLKKEGLGNGYSTPVMYRGDIYISGRRDSLEVLTKLNMAGDILWETAYGKAWIQSFPESRSTPTIHEGRAYIMGGLGKVNCLDVETGEILWSNNTHDNFEGEFHRWGMAESLLLTEEGVISSPVGGATAVVCLDRNDGSLVWKSDAVKGVRAYASPMLVSYQDRRMVLLHSSEELFAIDPGTGKILWSVDVVSGVTGERERRNVTNTPLYYRGEVYTSAGYDAMALMYSLGDGGNSASLKWKNDTLDNHHGGMVLVDGYIYGANWLNNGNGNWVCQDWETGRIMWEEKWINKGSIIYADGLLYLFEEKRGNLGLVRPSPEGFELISSFRIEGGSGPYWAHPSIYDRKLLVRHGEVLFVYDIGLKRD